MERVSSATAFVARYLAVAELDPAARDIIERLSLLERAALALLARVPGREQRRTRLANQTGELWDAARYDRLESRALLRLQDELQRRGLLQP